MACKGSGVQIPSAPPPETPCIYRGFRTFQGVLSECAGRLQPHANPTEGLVKGIGCGFIQSREQVPVRTEGGADGCMTHALLNHFCVEPLTDEQGGMRVAEVVETAGLTHCGLNRRKPYSLPEVTPAEATPIWACNQVAIGLRRVTGLLGKRQRSPPGSVSCTTRRVEGRK